MANQALSNGRALSRRGSTQAASNRRAGGGEPARRPWLLGLLAVWGLAASLPEAAQAQTAAVVKLTDRTSASGGREVYFKAHGASEDSALSTALSACRAELKAANSGSVVRSRSSCEPSTQADFQTASREAGRSRQLAANAD